MSASVHFNLSPSSDFTGNANYDRNYHNTTSDESTDVQQSFNHPPRGSKKSRAMLKRSFSLVPERLESNKSFKSNICNEKILKSCEFILLIFTVVLVVIFFPFSLIISFKVVAQYQRAVVFRLGRLINSGTQGPGLVFILPCLDTMKRIDLRTLTFDVPTQEVLTRDSVTVAVDAVVYYRIFDPVMSVVNVEDANRSTRLLAQTTLRNVLGTVDLTSLLTDREEIAASMQESLDTATDTWGMKVERVEIKDVRLPLQLQRAMAAEAEAAREAGAKVIAAEGEQRASHALRVAAEELSLCPVALQLRYLQTLNSISAEKNSTIIFPLPVDVLSAFHNPAAAPGDNVTGTDNPSGSGGMSAPSYYYSQQQQQPQPPHPNGTAPTYLHRSSSSSPVCLRAQQYQHQQHQQPHQQHQQQHYNYQKQHQPSVRVQMPSQRSSGLVQTSKKIITHDHYSSGGNTTPSSASTVSTAAAPPPVQHEYNSSECTV